MVLGHFATLLSRTVALCPTFTSLFRNYSVKNDYFFLFFAQIVQK